MNRLDVAYISFVLAIGNGVAAMVTGNLYLGIFAVLFAINGWGAALSR